MKITTSKTENSIFFKILPNENYVIHMEYFYKDEEAHLTLFDDIKKKLLISDDGSLNYICHQINNLINVNGDGYQFFKDIKSTIDDLIFFDRIDYKE